MGLFGGGRRQRGKSLKFRVSGHIEGVPKDFQLVSASLGVDGLLTCLWVHEDATRLVTVGESDSWDVVPLEPTDVPYPHIARLPVSGALVVVGARCTIKQGVAELNAHRFSAEGVWQASATLGDGIQVVCPDSDDNLWVGYYDEGVYGNNGWSWPNTPPIGASGLVCANSDFDIVWQMSEFTIDDCYSVVVAADSVYCCPYTEFPILRVAGGKASVFSPLGRASTGMAVSGTSVALLGTEYGKTLDGYVVDAQQGVHEPLVVLSPSGAKLPSNTVLCTAGAEAVIVSGREVWRASLDDL